MKNYDLASAHWIESATCEGFCQYCGKNGEMSSKVRTDYFTLIRPERIDPDYLRANRDREDYSALNQDEKEMSKYITHNCLDCWFHAPFRIRILLTESTFDVPAEMLQKYTYTLTKKKLIKKVSFCQKLGPSTSHYQGHVNKANLPDGWKIATILDLKEVVRFSNYDISFEYGWEIVITEISSGQKSRPNWLYFDKNRSTSFDPLAGLINGFEERFINELENKTGNHKLFTILDATQDETAVPITYVEPQALETFQKIINSYESDLMDLAEKASQLSIETIDLENQISTFKATTPRLTLIGFSILITIVSLIFLIIYWIIRITRKLFRKGSKF